MAITITRSGKKYLASVTPPHGNGQFWHNSVALTADALIEKLVGLGCHTMDIADAFYAADPFWLTSGSADSKDGRG